MAEIVLSRVKKVYPNESEKKGFFGKKKSKEKKHNLQVTDEGVLAVQDFNLTVHDHKFVVFVGASGCGKSTTLRMIAGLEEITDGELLIDGKRMNDVAPKDRDIVRDPKVFLMDEPLSNLDAKLRNQMRAELIKLRHEINGTFIYVTHDQTEAMTLGDRIVIMKDGVVQQIGTPQEVFNHPANIFVAGFIGVPQMNFIDASLVREGDGFHVETEHFNIPMAAAVCERVAKNVKDAKLDVTMGVRPEQIKICKPSDAGAVTGQIEVTELMGSTVHVHVTTPDGNFVLVIPANDLEGEGGTLAASDSISFKLDAETIHVFDKQTGITLS